MAIMPSVKMPQAWVASTGGHALGTALHLRLGNLCEAQFYWSFAMVYKASHPRDSQLSLSQRCKSRCGRSWRLVLMLQHVVGTSFKDPARPSVPWLQSAVIAWVAERRWPQKRQRPQIETIPPTDARRHAHSIPRYSSQRGQPEQTLLCRLTSSNSVEADATD